MKPRKTSKRALGITAGAALLVGMLVPAAGMAAVAATAGISGTVPSAGSTVYYDTPRTNTKSKNSVAIKQTANSAGGSLSVALRPTTSNSGTFARGTSGGSWAQVRHDNGNAWVGPGTFYISASPSGACGGSGCGVVSWGADLQYDVLWY